jgi:hypothetical protein
VEGAQRLGLVDVKDEDGGIGATEKRGRKGRKAFLPGRILWSCERFGRGGSRERAKGTDPDLESDRLFRVGVMGQRLGDKVGTDGRTVPRREVARDILYIFEFELARLEKPRDSLCAPDYGDSSCPLQSFR